MQIGPELRTFLKQRFSSADQIAIVLLLFQDPKRSWTALEVAAALSMAPESTAMRLFLLASAGLIAFEPDSVPRYRYTAMDDVADRLLRELAAAYADGSEQVLRVIDTARPDPLRTFADAFKLKN